ncbi:DNA-3-methyladenine glycosylase 2 family protein [Candidatus Poribacteria bacterium]|nr:DNA-3-methyladenine glycosylase 2 family protein [Candidatus Poribacteria bacterium]
MATVIAHIPLRSPLDLAATLAMGQTFCWSLADGWHIGSLGGTFVRVRPHEGGLFAQADASAEDLAHRIAEYFDADRDMGELHRRLSAIDENVADAVAFCPEVRILRQPLWECLAGFILSSVNNVARITGIVRRLSQRFGERRRLEYTEGYAFPSPERLAEAAPQELVACGTGFRHRALREAAAAVAEGRLTGEGLSVLSYDRAHAALRTLHGVGDKIADCVALYALGMGEACPIDVWIRRELERLYFGGRQVPVATIRAFVRERYGTDAGYAQLYLYHRGRMRSRSV